MKRLYLAAAYIVAVGHSASAQDAAFEQATIPLEVVGSASGASEGSGDDAKLRIDLSLRAAGSIVLLRGGRSAETLPLAIVGPVPRDASGRAMLPANPAQIAWCEHDRGLRLGTGSRFTCWQDLDGDGQLETKRATLAVNFSRPLSIALVGTRKEVDRPIPYRVAASEERIAYTLEYRSCGPLSGKQFRRNLDNAPGMSANDCRFRAEKTADLAGPPRWQLDRFVFTFSRGGDLQVLEQPATGTFLDRYDDAEPLVDLGTRKRYDREREALLAPLREPSFQFAEPPQVASGVVAKDDKLMEGSLRYGYTGRLVTPFVLRESFSSRELPAGSLVYGVPMGEAVFGKPTITWCSPVQEKSRWVARCLVTAPNGGVQLLERQLPAFAVTTVSYAVSNNRLRESLPDIDERAEFDAPLAARLSFLRWTDKTVRLRHEVLRNGEVVSSWESDYPRLPGGSAVLKFGEGQLRLASSGKDGAQVIIEEPVAGGASILPSCTDNRRYRIRVLQ